MKIIDARFKKQELSFEELVGAKVYVSSRLQKYVFKTKYIVVVCLETGETYDDVQLDGDVFTPVEAEMIIK